MKHILIVCVSVGFYIRGRLNSTDIHLQYLVFPLPPLITSPQASTQLSWAALKHNLEAHAACNPSIITIGTRLEMVQRLSDILKIRKLDMLLMDMLNGNNSGLGK